MLSRLAKISQNTQPACRQAGFSLLELVVAIVILAMVITIGFQTIADIGTRTAGIQRKVIWVDKMDIIFNGFYTFYNSSASNVGLVEKLDTNPSSTTYVTGHNIALIVDNTMADASAVLADRQLLLHTIKIDMPSPNVFYRVIHTTNSCYFSSGSDYQYQVTCTTEADTMPLNNTMDELFNTNKILALDLSMLDGRVCKVIGYVHASNTWTLSPNTGCPINTNAVLANASPTTYFMPPRLVLFAKDGSLNYSRSVLESLVSPIDRELN